MTRMTGPDCAVMCNLINTHTHTHIPPWEDQCEWPRMTRMAGPDCAVMCNLINTHLLQAGRRVFPYLLNVVTGMLQWSDRSNQSGLSPREHKSSKVCGA